ACCSTGLQPVTCGVTGARRHGLNTRATRVGLFFFVPPTLASWRLGVHLLFLGILVLSIHAQAEDADTGASAAFTSHDSVVKQALLMLDVGNFSRAQKFISTTQ